MTLQQDFPARSHHLSDSDLGQRLRANSFARCLIVLDAFCESRDSHFRVSLLTIIAVERTASPMPMAIMTALITEYIQLLPSVVYFKSTARIVTANMAQTTTRPRTGRTIAMPLSK